MEKTTQNLDTFFYEAGDYIENKTELFKLKLADKTSEVISTTAAGVATSVLALIFCILFSVAVSLWLGEVTGKSYYGFFIVSAFYALIAIMVHVFRDKWLKTPVSNIILKKLFK